MHMWVCLGERRGREILSSLGFACDWLGDIWIGWRMRAAVGVL